MIKNRIEKNWRKLEGWAKKFQIEACRLYDRDIPEYPFIVDRYGDHFVIYDRGDEEIDREEKKRDHLPQLIRGLRELFGVPESQIVLKRRARQKGVSQYEKIDASGRTLVVRETQAQFLVNLFDYIDTGLFLDHRLMRQKIFSQAKDKDFLNLFSYTGSVSVFAALGGARTTTSVDMSATYSDWARENFVLNQIPLTSHKFVTENALEFLDNPSPSRAFDLIFLDPPTFSNSKRMDGTFEVERDQEFIVTRAMLRLRPGGTLYFSNNKRSFKLAPDLEETFSVRDITAQTIPKDFRDEKIHRVYEIKAIL